MIEIEYKFKISKDKINSIEDRLMNLGFSSKGRFYEKTTMYDNTSKIMQKTNGRIRIRLINNETVEFSYKKPLITHSGPKKEIEYEVVINQDNAEVNLVNILKMMNFKPTSSYERYRTTYSNGKVKVTIDEFPFADFVEIEGDEDKVTDIAFKLQFNVKEHLNDPCDTLFSQWRKKKGLKPSNHMTFNDYYK